MASENKQISLEWRDGLRFVGEAPSGRTVLVDGNAEQAPSPMELLLISAAGCTAADVVVILQKMRIELDTVRVEVTGTRREEEPRRYTAIRLLYRLAGTGLDEVKARRAIDLSLDKYCSVMHSLAADLQISYEVQLG